MPVFGLVVQLVLGILTQGPAALRQLIEIGRQTRALTDEQADSFLAEMNSAFASSRWQTDEQRGAGGDAPAGAPGTAANIPGAPSEPPQGG